MVRDDTSHRGEESHRGYSLTLEITKGLLPWLKSMPKTKQTSVRGSKCSYLGMSATAKNDIRFDACQLGFDLAHIVLILTE